MTPSRDGISFIEISLAVLVLAMALLPVFGLITGGLALTDLSAGYSSSIELASALMNKLLADELPFESIPSSPDGRYPDPAGSVAANEALNPVFDEAAWTVEGTARVRMKDGLSYKVELWVGNCARDSDLVFRYLRNPEIDFEKASPSTYFYSARRLAESDWAFSPYNAASDKRIGSAWASQVVTSNQRLLSQPPPSTPTVNQNLKKLALRVTWEAREMKRRGMGERAKEFWLVSLRANLGGGS